MNYTVYRQLPKPKKIGTGQLDLDAKGEAYLFIDDKLAGQLLRTRVEGIHRDGIKLSGFEDIGVGRDGKIKYLYQEWWCAYPEDLP